ncbi:superoxide dismutase family protein [Streptomyces tardus]|nr:superoxide dismutase family protein [Streptomyces tardus]
MAMPTRNGTRALLAAVGAVALLAPAATATATGAGARTDHEEPLRHQSAQNAPHTSPESERAPGGSWIAAGGSFEKAEGGRVPAAVTYDSAVPVGSGITVAQRLTGKGTGVMVWVDGLESDRSFGAHVHTKPCGARPDDSGPHYQHRVDPVQPSVDPAYANPRNEVWLDFDSDAEGSGRASAKQKWNFREGGARSVVIHEHSTHTEEGHAGQAGARLACVNVPFAAAG